MARLGKKGSKMRRIPPKKGKAGGMPGSDELQDGLKGLEAHIAERKKKGFARKRRKTKRGGY